MDKRGLDEAGQIAWVLQFAQAEVGQWRTGDWLNALEDALQIVGGDNRGVTLARQCITSNDDWTTPKDDRLSVADAEALLRPVQHYLKEFLDRLEASRKFAAHPGPVLPFAGKCQFLVMAEGNQRRVLYLPVESSRSDRLAKMLLLRLGTLLTLLGLSHLRQCPECGKLFLAVRHQRFDTPRCAVRDRVRRFQKKQRGKRPVTTLSTDRSGHRPRRTI